MDHERKSLIVFRDGIFGPKFATVDLVSLHVDGSTAVDLEFWPNSSYSHPISE